MQDSQKRLDLIENSLQEGITLRQQCSQLLRDPLIKAADAMIHCLENGGKILVCGNGGSAADAQHFAAELVNRFEINRRGLASVALTHDASVITSIANDFSFDQVFSRQVEALGNAGDLLLAISTSGNSGNVCKAVEAARLQGMTSVGLTGRDGGELGAHPSLDIVINIPHPSTARVQEMHITCLHILCSMIDQHISGGNA